MWIVLTNCSILQGSEIEHLVEKVIPHPDYDKATVDNDVALLKISMNDADQLFGNFKKRGVKKYRHRKSPRISSFSPACLPDENAELPVGTKCTIVGWGKERNKNVFGTDVLHEAEVRILFY